MQPLGKRKFPFHICIYTLASLSGNHWFGVQPCDQTSTNELFVIWKQKRSGNKCHTVIWTIFWKKLWVVENFLGTYMILMRGHWCLCIVLKISSGWGTWLGHDGLVFLFPPWSVALCGSFLPQGMKSLSPALVLQLQFSPGICHTMAHTCAYMRQNLSSHHFLTVRINIPNFPTFVMIVRTVDKKLNSAAAAQKK